MFCVKNNCVLLILVKQSKKTWLQNIFDILGWQKTTKLRIFVRRLIHNKIFKTLAWGFSTWLMSVMCVCGLVMRRFFKCNTIYYIWK